MRPVGVSCSTSAPGSRRAAAVTSTAFLQIAFNVLFFVPLGFLIAYALSRGIGTALLAGFGVSLLIESTQGTGLWGLYPSGCRPL